MQLTEQENMWWKRSSNPEMEELERRFTSASGSLKTSLQDSWDSQADGWDKKYRCEEEREEHQVRIRDVSAWLRQRGLLGPEQVVADIGCGPGRFVAEFAKTAHSVTGVDISPKMTRYGEDWCRELGLNNTSFQTVDFANADISALGWEGKFDLAFSSITSAISSLQGVENLIKISRGWCFNACYVYRNNPWQTDIMHNLFDREPRKSKTTHSHWFYELFSLLWFMGYYPETQYYTQFKSVRLEANKATAKRLTRFLLEENEVTDETVLRVLKYLEEHADPQGFVKGDSESRFGWILWNVNDCHNRLLDRSVT